MKKLVFVMALMISSVLMTEAGDKKEGPLKSVGDPSFAFSLLKDVASSQSDGVVCVSPLSASVALSMAAEGAQGETRAEILSVLGFSDADAFREYYSGLLKILNDPLSGITLNMANSLWLSDEFSLRCRYRSNMRRYYDAMVSREDFSDAATADKINRWCSENTASRIDKMVDAIDPSTVMYILNALYFKGSWAQPFNPERTSSDEFYGIEGTSQVKFMRDNGYYMYGYASHDTDGAPVCSENGVCAVPAPLSNSAQILELPYGEDGRYVMDIVLPSKDVCFEEYLASFDNTSLETLLESMYSQEMDIAIPMFKAECDMALNEPLQRLGIQTAFTPAADFSLMSKKDRLMIGQVKQKTFIEVNEEGSEAAAVTSITIMRTSINHDAPKPFVANRPFIFMIRERTSGTILFNGVVRNL